MNNSLFSSFRQFEFTHKNNHSPLLGIGAFAKILLALHKKTQSLYALKIVSLHKQISKLQKTQQEINFIYNQIQVHQDLHHNNILKLISSFQQHGLVVLVLEYCPNNNVFKFIKGKTLPQKQIHRIFIQTLKGIRYLHNKQIYHRDIKPQNLLLSDKNQIKICDFGYSISGLYNYQDSTCGTYQYMAPQIVNKRLYNYKVDIWSLGILLYQMCHGQVPFKGNNLDQIKESLQNHPTYSHTISKQLKDLIQSLLSIEPHLRPDVHQIFEFEWIQKFYTKQRKRIFTQILSTSTSQFFNMLSSISEKPSYLPKFNNSKQIATQTCDKLISQRQAKQKKKKTKIFKECMLKHKNDKCVNSYYENKANKGLRVLTQSVIINGSTKYSYQTKKQKQNKSISKYRIRMTDKYSKKDFQLLVKQSTQKECFCLKL